MMKKGGRGRIEGEEHGGGGGEELRDQAGAVSTGKVPLESYIMEVDSLLYHHKLDLSGMIGVWCWRSVGASRNILTLTPHWVG